VDEPTKATTKAATMTGFSWNFSISSPAGMDMTPYAMKNANGSTATRVRLKSKSSIISGTRGPMMFVRNEITKKVRKIRPTT
jgi:hypothetical protein